MVDLSNEVEALERVFNNAESKPIKISYAALKYITNDFTQVIGDGGFSVVYLGGLQKGMVAVKKLSISSNRYDNQFWDEVTCLERAKHQNIARFLGYCADKVDELAEVEGKRTVVTVEQRLLCFEYVPNGSLHQYLKEKNFGYEWNIRYQIIKGICEGLHYLHQKLIYHLDLKPANVLLDAYIEPKIVDFGCSRCADDEVFTTLTESFFGTPGYIAPELIDYGGVSKKSDIFSLGIMMIQILTGHDRIGPDWIELVDAACPQTTRCIDIAKICINEDPDKRPTIDEIVDMLNETETMIKTDLPITKEPRSDPHSSLYQVVRRFKERFAKTLPRNFSLKDIYTELNVLDSILEGKKEPGNLSYQLLRFITENFAEEHIIGKGGFSKIYKGSRSIAVKRLFGWNCIDDWRFYQEVKTATMAQHKNVVQFLGHCAYTEQMEVEYEGKIVVADMPERLFCFEYLRNGSLHNYLSDASRAVDWRERYEIIKGIFEGLHYLHRKRIVHLDLKPDNILLDDNMVPKIADFGLARCLGYGQTQSFVTFIAGTRGYMPPETYDQVITLRADMYSLGVVIADVLTVDKYSAIQNAQISFQNALEYWRNGVGGSEELLEQLKVCAMISVACLDKDPAMRPDMKGIIKTIFETKQLIEKGVRVKSLILKILKKCHVDPKGAMILHKRQGGQQCIYDFFYRWRQEVKEGEGAIAFL